MKVTKYLRNPFISSHASVRFENEDRVKEILSEKKNLKVLGKKLYVSPAYRCLLMDMPKLGEPWLGDQNTPKTQQVKFCIQIKFLIGSKLFMSIPGEKIPRVTKQENENGR